MHILFNARIHTQNASQPFASAVATHNGRVLAVGSDADVLAAADRSTITTDLNGCTVLPGMVDSHFHLQQYALNLSRVNCAAPTIQECLDRIANRAAEMPPGEWLLGHGWNQNEWAGVYGTASQLDRAAPNNPVYLTAQSLHAGWANTMALQQSGVTALGKDPAGGKIQRDAHGQPTGILLEAACALIENKIPPPSLNLLCSSIETAQTSLWKLGITGVHDFDGERCFAALQILTHDHKLRLRVLKSIPLGLIQEASALQLRTGFGGQWLQIGGIKLFADGALGPQTAAMLSSYENAPENSGLLLLDADEIARIGIQAVQNGLSLAVHAIGDLANREALNAFAEIRKHEKQNALPALRHRIEHVQIIHPDDAPRFATLDLIASVQPVHLFSDMATAERFWGKRCVGAYAYNTLQRHGVRMTFGSDAPVETCNPFFGLQAAVTRSQLVSRDNSCWYPGERLSLDTALKGFTTGAAYASGREHIYGQLSAGCKADMIVTKRDPFSVSPGELHSITIEKTMVNGEWVWQE